MKARHTTPEAWVADQSLIRVFFDSTPGLGNQAASLQLMNRLRAMGFKGRFECIYPGVAKKKMAELFGLPADIPDFVKDERRNSTLIEKEIHNQRIADNIAEPCTLSFSAAERTVCGNYFRIICYYEANALGSEIDINILSWLHMPVMIHQRDVFYGTILQNTRCTMFLSPTESFADAEAYLQTSQGGKTLLAQRPGLATFVQGIKRHEFNVIAAYGWHLVDIVEGRYDSAFPSTIMECLLGARYAQLYGPSSMRDKPLVFAVFYHYKEEFELLKKLLKRDPPNKGVVIRDNEMRQFMTDNRLPEVLSYASLADPDSSSTLANLMPGEILLLAVGELPQVVFNGIFINGGDSIIMRIHEGESTRNALLSGPNKPFMHTSSLIPNLCARYEIYPELNKRYYDLRTRFNFKFDLPYSAFKDNIVRNGMNVGKYIIEANNSTSEVSEYFNTLYQEARNPARDRIYVALQTALTMHNQIVPEKIAASSQTCVVPASFFWKGALATLSFPLIADKDNNTSTTSYSARVEVDVKLLIVLLAGSAILLYLLLNILCQFGRPSKQILDDQSDRNSRRCPGLS